MAFFPQVHNIQFLEFSEAENQDDFHSTQAGCVHTQDQFGAYVVYDIALQDLKELESELLFIASHYIEKEKSKERDFFLRNQLAGAGDEVQW